MKKLLLLLFILVVNVQAQSLTETIIFEDGTSMTTIVDENGIYSDRDIDSIDSAPSSATATMPDGSSIYGSFSDENIIITDDEGNVLLDLNYDDVMSDLGEDSSILDSYDEYDSYDYDSSYDYDIY